LTEHFTQAIIDSFSAVDFQKEYYMDRAQKKWTTTALGLAAVDLAIIVREVTGYRCEFTVVTPKTGFPGDGSPFLVMQPIANEEDFGISPQALRDKIWAALGNHCTANPGGLASHTPLKIVPPGLNYRNYARRGLHFERTL
jgi:hypothetical protein